MIKLSMKVVEVPILKPAAVSIHKEAVRGSLSWHPDSHCDSFTREAILLFAPRTSGVYGLFNFDCQIFIGESANIQEALLRHESETDFQSRHLQPTGFTFEPCEAELRKTKADELIAKFHPVLQSEAALTEIYLLTDDLVVNEPDVGDEDSVVFAKYQQFFEHERNERPKVRRSLHAQRTLTVRLIATLIASALAIFYFSAPADYRIRVQASGANVTWARAETILRSQNAPSIDAPSNTASPNAGTTLATPESRAVSTPPDDAAWAATKSTQADEAAAQLKPNPIAHSVDGVKSGKKWSVQISAAPAQEIAEALMERLKIDGYHGYVVPAKVNGKTYFRVRIGPFDGRDEAESVRQSLARQDGYRDAYLSGD
jgi:cell division septation protein DedD